MKIILSSSLILSIILYLQQPCQGQHVIFENIGQMAGALSYQHAKLTLNLSSIFLQYERYDSSLHNLFHNISHSDPHDILHNNSFRYSLSKTLRESRQINIETIKLHINEAQDLGEMVATLQHILPEVAQPEPPQAAPVRHGRSFDFNKMKKKVSMASKGINIISKAVSMASGGLNFSSLLGLPFGIFATFMGLYNGAQINQLRKELYRTIEAHNRLVEVVDQQEHHLEIIDAQLLDLANVLHFTVMQNPGYTSARLSRIESQIRRRIKIAIHTIQQAQHRRLAVDFLTASQLDVLFIKLQEQAILNGCQLLIQHRSDLFQLEASYFFDGADVHILLHVPMVPNDSLLRLFKLHPFPLPLSGSHVFIPAVKDDILALSSGFQRYSAQLSGTDLLGCHVVNNIYLCERHGVLNSRLNNTCLGSLYMQDFDAVKKSCVLEIHKTGEIVHQLLNNWYLVFSTTPQTAPISCYNGTQSEKHISKGTNRIYISPGCRAHLASHLIISDISVKLESDLLHFEWKWDDVTLEGLGTDIITPQLSLLEESGLFRPTLSDLYELNMHQKQSPHWWTILANFIGNIVLFCFVFFLTLFLTIRFVQFRKNRKNSKSPNPVPEDE